MQPLHLECFRPADLTTSWHERKVRIPDSLDKFARITHLTLAHFTSSVILRAILSSGIQPRSGGAIAIEDGCHTEAEYVYLCSGVDKHYFERAVKAHGGVGLAVVVRVPVSMLRGDSNVIAPEALRGLGEIEALHRSLIAGVCGHQGPVPPEAVLAVVDEAGAPFQVTPGQ